MILKIVLISIMVLPLIPILRMLFIKRNKLYNLRGQIDELETKRTKLAENIAEITKSNTASKNKGLNIELAEVMDKIDSTREVYNEAVRSYNKMICMFPINTIAMITGFKKQPFG